MSRFFTGGALVLALLLAGGVRPASPQTHPPIAGYPVGPQDLLAITVFEVPTMTGDYRVSQDGVITLPLMGDLPVRGLQAAEIEQRLKRLLEEKGVQRPTVQVEVREFKSRPITVIGSVAKPGPLDYSGRWTLMEALLAAGGLAADNGGVVYVLRRADNGLTDRLPVRAEDLFGNTDPVVNVPIYANDVIHVPPASTVTIYLLGEIQGGSLTFKSTEHPTLLTAIARSGGFTERASRTIAVKRKQGDRLQEIVVDYKDLLAGRIPDVELRDGDILFVKESFF